MVRLSKRTEQRDVLDVLAASRREIRLTLQSDRPLRKGGNRAQRQRLAHIRSALSHQVETKMSGDARRVFRDRIAVELRLVLPEGRDAAALGPIVKAYLDLLSGPVVPDDKCIDHLVVLREESGDDKAHAVVTCLPSRLLAADYDRAFRVLPQGAAASLIEQPEPNPTEFPAPANAVWGLAPFDEVSRKLLAWDESTLGVIKELDEQEAEQLAEDPDALVDLDIPSGYDEFADSEIRASTRRHLEASIARRYGDWMTDQGFDARDRPGRRPAWREEAVELDAADVLELDDRGRGCFVLPAPPTRRTAIGATRWEEQIESIFAGARSGWWTSVRFCGPLALDVALRGNAGKHADVDNVTRKILAAFCSAFADAEPRFAGYRVYRLDAKTDDVRVRAIPAVRLEALARAMRHARDVLREERSERMRD